VAETSKSRRDRHSNIEQVRGTHLLVRITEARQH
jgi:hypothetical protein